MRVDIAIVGGGVVGAACAGALARAGFSIRLIERGPRPLTPDGRDQRVYALNQASVRGLREAGVWDAIAGHAEPVYAMHIWDQTPSRPLRFDAPPPGGAPLAWIVEHQRVLAALWEGLPPLHCQCDSPVSDVEWTTDGVRVMDDQGGAVEADLVIAADGGDSPVRAAADLDVVHRPYAHDAIVCDVEASDAAPGTAYQRFLSTGPLAFLPVGAGRWSIVWSVERNLAEQLMAHDDDAFAQALSDAAQGELGTVRVASRRYCVPLRLMHATHYAADRVALIGDAAHVIHPLAGQGVNLGLADVRSLARVLAASRAAGRRWWARRTLAAYERERTAANLEMLSLTDALYRAYSIDAGSWRRLLSTGLNLVDAASPAKEALLRRALG